MEPYSKPDLLVSTVVTPPVLGTYAHDALWRLSESTLSFLRGFLPSLSRGIPGPNLPTAYLTDLLHVAQAGSTSSRPRASAQASLFLLLCGSHPLLPESSATQKSRPTPCPRTQARNNLSALRLTIPLLMWPRENNYSFLLLSLFVL